MKIVSKLLPALMAAVLVVSFADGASATKRLPEGVQAPAGRDTARSDMEILL